MPGTITTAWRIDAQSRAARWDSGLGAERVGGRWNPRGVKAVYCSIDPSTCILEAAVHRGFRVLDTEPHVLSRLSIDAGRGLRIVGPEELPNPAWLHGGVPSAGQQAFGAALLAAHAFVVLPSAVSKLSWNLVFSPEAAAGAYTRQSHERLVIDTRLHPGAA